MNTIIIAKALLFYYRIHGVTFGGFVVNTNVHKNKYIKYCGMLHIFCLLAFYAYYYFISFSHYSNNFHMDFDGISVVIIVSNIMVLMILIHHLIIIYTFNNQTGYEIMALFIENCKYFIRHKLRFKMVLLLLSWSFLMLLILILAIFLIIVNYTKMPIYWPILVFCYYQYYILKYMASFITWFTSFYAVDMINDISNNITDNLVYDNQS